MSQTRFSPPPSRHLNKQHPPPPPIPLSSVPKFLARWESSAQAALDRLMADWGASKKLTEEDFAFLSTAVLYLHLPEHNAFAVHAGVCPDMAIDVASLPIGRDEACGAFLSTDQRDRLLRVRVTRPATGEKVQRNNMKAEHGDAYWAEIYDRRFGHVFFGHEAYTHGKDGYGRTLMGPADDAVEAAPLYKFQHATGIDHGCVYGGQLTAAVLAAGQDATAEAATLVSVPAAECYCEQNQKKREANKRGGGVGGGGGGSTVGGGKPPKPRPPTCHIPEYRQRTAEAHARHMLELASFSPARSEEIDTLLLGSSFFERILPSADINSPGHWPDCPRRVFNAGAGPDCIENLLWRCFPYEDMKRAKLCNKAGLLTSAGLRLRHIVICVGTNNFAVKDPPSTVEDFIGGMRKLIEGCIQEQPALKRVLVCGLACSNPGEDQQKKSTVWRNLRGQYNVALRALCSELTEPLSQGEDTNGVRVDYSDYLEACVDPASFCDPLLLTAEAYAGWVQVLSREVESMAPESEGEGEGEE